MKKSVIHFVIIILFTSVLSAQTFQSFVNRVSAAPDSERAGIVDSFLIAHPHLPYAENDTTVHFIYKGNATSVAMAGDANAWNPGSSSMTKISTTTLWYLTKKYESDARLDYKFVLNGTNWIPDPKNPYQVSGGYGPNSELRMPGYVPAPEFQYYSAIPHGTFKDSTFHSIALNNNRTVRVYLPPGYSSSADSFPVLLVHDGLDYINLGKTNNILDYLIENKRIRPVIAVFIPAVNRDPEYSGNQITQFSSFITGEIIPFIDSRYRTMKDPHFRATLGASNGGDIALYLGAFHSNVFGNIAAQSSNIISSIKTQFQNSPKMDLKLYLDLGTYDINVLIPLVRNFIPVIQSKGYNYFYKEYHEGHSWGSWRAHIDDALEFFFPGEALAVENEMQSPSSIELLQNYPNPFNPSTTIRYSLPVKSYVTLKVYNVLGKEIATIAHEIQEPGVKMKEWNADGFPSGIYLLQLQARDREGLERTMVNKMLLVR